MVRNPTEGRIQVMKSLIVVEEELRAIEKFDFLEGDIVEKVVSNYAVFEVSGLETLEDAGASILRGLCLRKIFCLNMKEFSEFYEDKNN